MTALCRRWTLFLIVVGSLTRLTLPAAANDQSPPDIRVGIIGLDTSHVVHFTRLLNAENPPPKLAGCRVVAAYPQGSPDIESSVSRVPRYTQEVQAMGVEIVDSSLGYNSHLYRASDNKKLQSERSLFSPTYRDCNLCALFQP